MVVLGLYDKMMDGIISEDEKRMLHEIATNQHQKEDTPVGIYNPKTCPCSYGICSECKY